MVESDEGRMLRYRDLCLVAPESRGAMNSLRKWLYRPRRDDKSLLAKFGTHGDVDGNLPSVDNEIVFCQHFGYVKAQL